LKASVTDVGLQLEQAKREEQDRAAEVNRLAAQLEEARAEGTDKIELQAKMESATIALAEAHQQHEAALEEAAVLKEVVAKVEADRDVLNGQLEAAHTVIGEKDAVIEERTAELQNLKREKELIQLELDAARALVTSKVDGAQQELKAKDEERVQLEAAKKETLAKMVDALNQAEEAKAELARVDLANTARVNELVQQLASASADAQQLEEASAKGKNSMAQLAEEKQELEQKVTKYEAKLEELKVVEKQRADLESRVSELAATSEKSLQSVASLSAERTAQDEAISALRTKLTSLEQSEQAAKKELGSAPSKQEFATIAAERDQLLQEIKQLRSKLSSSASSPAEAPAAAAPGAEPKAKPEAPESFDASIDRLRAVKPREGETADAFSKRQFEAIRDLDPKVQQKGESDEHYARRQRVYKVHTTSWLDRWLASILMIE